MERSPDDGTSSGGASTSTSTIEDWAAFERMDQQKKFECFCSLRKKLKDDRFANKFDYIVHDMDTVIKAINSGPPGYTYTVSEHDDIQNLHANNLSTTVRLDPALTSNQRRKLRNTAINQFRMTVVD